MTDSLLPCPHCLGEPEYLEDSNYQAAAIYCTDCPLGLEWAGMSYEDLSKIWNSLPRYSLLPKGIKPNP